MDEISGKYVTKAEFRAVAAGLAALIAAVIYLIAIHRNALPNQPPPPPPETPILVRGGSMTAFTVAANGWVQHPDKTTYCADAAVTYLEFDNGGDGTSTTWPSTASPNAIGQWKVEIHGHDGGDHPHGKKPSANGLTFTSQSQNCNGDDTTKSSVLVSTLGAGKFYPPPPLPASGNRTGNLRFLDEFQSGGVCSGADTTDSNKADQEFCERMEEVDVTLYRGTGSETKEPPLVCLDGDCTVSFKGP
jgi:hypothetical protein